MREMGPPPDRLSMLNCSTTSRVPLLSRRMVLERSHRELSCDVSDGVRALFVAEQSSSASRSMRNCSTTSRVPLLSRRMILERSHREFSCDVSDGVRALFVAEQSSSESRSRGVPSLA